VWALKKFVSGISFALLFVSMFTVAFNIQSIDRARIDERENMLEKSVSGAAILRLWKYL
jgi:hypothetical protein